MKWPFVLKMFRFDDFQRTKHQLYWNEFCVPLFLSLSLYFCASVHAQVEITTSKRWVEFMTTKLCSVCTEIRCRSSQNLNGSITLFHGPSQLNANNSFLLHFTKNNGALCHDVPHKIYEHTHAQSHRFVYEWFVFQQLIGPVAMLTARYNRTGKIWPSKTYRLEKPNYNQNVSTNIHKIHIKTPVNCMLYINCE